MPGTVLGAKLTSETKQRFCLQGTRNVRRGRQIIHNTMRKTSRCASSDAHRGLKSELSWEVGGGKGVTGLHRARDLPTGIWSWGWLSGRKGTSRAKSRKWPRSTCPEGQPCPPEPSQPPFLASKSPESGVFKLLCEGPTVEFWGCEDGWGGGLMGSPPLPCNFNRFSRAGLLVRVHSEKGFHSFIKSLRTTSIKIERNNH